MLRTTYVISRGILPVCIIAFCDEGCIEVLSCYVRSCTATGVAGHLVFIVNVMQPLPAIDPCNLDASEDKLRLSKLSLGEAKGPRLVCRKPIPKCASRGW